MSSVSAKTKLWMRHNLYCALETHLKLQTQSKAVCEVCQPAKVPAKIHTHTHTHTHLGDLDTLRFIIVFLRVAASSQVACQHRMVSRFTPLPLNSVPLTDKHHRQKVKSNYRLWLKMFSLFSIFSFLLNCIDVGNMTTKTRPYPGNILCRHFNVFRVGLYTEESGRGRPEKKRQRERKDKRQKLVATKEKRGNEISCKTKAGRSLQFGKD